MVKGWSLGQKIGAGFALALLSLLWVGLTAFDRFETLIGDNAAIAHSYKVLGSLSQVQFDVNQAEGAVQGYAATGREHFLSAYAVHKTSLENDRKELRRLLKDNPDQLGRVTALETMINQRMTMLADAIKARQKGQGSRSVRLAGPDVSRELTLRTDRLVGEIQSEERALLRGREEGAAAAARNTQLTIMTVLCLALTLVAILGGLIVRGLLVAVRPLVEGARSVGSGDLSYRVPVRDDDEIGQLAKAFNDMADQLQRERHTTQEELVTSHDRLEELVDNLQLRHQQGDLLRRMLELLESSVDRTEAFRTASPFFVRLFPNSAGAVMAINASKSQVDTVAWWGQEKAPDVFTPGACWSLRRGTLHLAREGDPEPFCAHVEEDCECSLCVPMVAQGEALGVLHLRPHEGHALSQETLELAQSVAEQLSLAMANLSLRDTLRQQSIRDPLTGLFNRRFMEESLEREIFRARRKREPVSVIMLDVDHFKRFNDQYGHDAGDVVIQAVGRHLREAVRAEDVVCRYGGEEFVLIMPGSTLSHASQRAESLRTGVNQLALSLGTTQLPRVTVSIGVASYPMNGQTTATLIKSADQALYQAKRNGRDRIVVAAMPELKVGTVAN